jgi:hypothetical protein
MNQGILLKNNQWLQGSGLSFYAFSTVGPVMVPSQTTKSTYLLASKGVTLANNNIVNGFVVAATGTGIFGQNVNGAEITSNKIAVVGGTNIVLNNAQGLITIKEIRAGVSTVYTYHRVAVST